MTNQYLRNITADYITGTVSACEGIKDSLVLLNGPLGCRFYHGYASGQSIIKESELWNLRGELALENAMDDKLIRSQYFAGTPQIPGTNLRYEDNIFGTREQLHRALSDIFAERKYTVLTVIQTPGTSLLGEELAEELLKISRTYGTPCLFIESPHFSDNAYIGYDESTVKLLELLITGEWNCSVKKKRPAVNIFGFHSYEKYLEGDVNEVMRLLSLCGIDVNCVVGANCSLERFQSIPSADANIVFSPERCHETTRYLCEKFSIPVFDFGCVPVGFALTEKFVREISEFLHTDCAPALEDIERARARAFYYIARHMGAKGFPKDLRYAVEGEFSLLYAYVDYISGYLGIKPLCIHPLYIGCFDGAKKKLEYTLRQIHAEEALNYDISKVKDAIMLGSANTILAVTAYSQNIYGIETANPSSGYINVVPKTHLGCAGALFLLEQILNGVRLLNAWN